MIYLGKKIIFIFLVSVYLNGCSTPPVALPNGTLTVGEVVAVLNREKIITGQVIGGEVFDSLSDRVTGSGFSPMQIDEGRVAVLRDYIYWNNTVSGIKRSHIFMALIPEGVAVDVGQIVEVEVTQSGPELIRKVRAGSLAEGGCYFATLDSGALHEFLGGISLVGASGTASLYCAGIELDGWQRPRTLWHKLPEGSQNAPSPAPMPAYAVPAPPIVSSPLFPGGAATLVFYKRVGDFMFALPFLVDGKVITEIGGRAGCDVVRLPPGRYTVLVGDEPPKSFTIFPRRTIVVDLKVGERKVIEYSADLNLLNHPPLSDLFDSQHTWLNKVYQISQRPATEKDTCMLRGPAKVISGPYHSTLP